MLDQLGQLGLSGMAKAFAELEASDETATLTHADWFGLLVDREITHRRDKRLAARLRYARLRQQASVEDIDYRVPRGLDRALLHKLTNGEWIDAHDNLILCGPTGIRKSWLACALGHKACRDNRSVLYQRVPKLFAELALARGDGRYARILRGLTGVHLLILDDWGLEPLDAGARRDLYEILEERYGRRSTILTSQIPVEMARLHWRPNICRRHPRPPRSQRPPHRSRRREPETRTRQIEPKGLTTSLQLWQKSTASKAPASQATSSRIAGRHHLGISGRLRQNLQKAAKEAPVSQQRGPTSFPARQGDEFGWAGPTGTFLNNSVRQRKF
jgi:DNA replication protein DnaC